MSRYSYDWPREVVEDQRKLRMESLKRMGLIGGQFYNGEIIWWHNGKEEGRIGVEIETRDSQDLYIKFVYRTKESGEPESHWRDYQYRFDLEKIPCYFGGFKWFFKCGLTKNGTYCGKRVRILYKIGDYLGCRHCANLSYESCNSSWKQREFATAISCLDKIDNLKRHFYRGRPTKKYRRYLQGIKNFNG